MTSTAFGCIIIKTKEKACDGSGGTEETVKKDGNRARDRSLRIEYLLACQRRSSVRLSRIYERCFSSIAVLVVLPWCSV